MWVIWEGFAMLEPVGEPEPAHRNVAVNKVRRGNDRWFAAYHAVEHVHAPFGETPQQISRRRIANPVYGQRNRRFAGLGRNPVSEVRSVNKHDIAADRLELGN